MQFTKLNKKFDVSKFTEATLFNSYTKDGKGIAFYNINNYQRNLILSVIPERFRNDFLIKEMKINCNIPPHTDSYITATINFYVKANDCETKFYKKVDDNIGVKMTNQTNGRTYKEDQLEFTGSFVAETNDVWLLDVSNPHSVQSLNTNEVDRVAIVLNSLKYNFDQVYAMLQETGYISD